VIKKIISLFVLTAFVVFTFSCYTTKTEGVETIVWTKGSKAKILAVLKKSGERIEFVKGEPGKIVGDKILGEAVDETNKKKHVSIPISDVDQVLVKKFSLLKTSLFVVGSITVAFIALVVYVASQDPSCPFIYSFDGEKYRFDAEPYTGAICQGLKRTEWCGLQHIKEVNGEYRILVSNEVDETEYIDELKLLVIDHPIGVRVAPGPWGSLHTISKPIVPVRAYDQKGNDLTSYVCENDWIFWQSQDETKSVDKKEDLKDELIFEFPKPQNAARARLLFNGTTTLWGSQVLKRYLNLYGSKVYEWYDAINNRGLDFLKMANTQLREELYSLQIRVETKTGWKSKGIILGGAPLASEDKVYILDLEDVPSDTLKIKLTPPAAYWKINYLAVDYTEDFSVTTTEIQAVKAVDHKGQEVGKRLTETDNNYLVMPNIGDSVELVFPAPERIAHMERTVILKASGYYDIHLNAQGEPQIETLNRIHNQPGFALQYSFKEYLHWKQENMEKWLWKEKSSYNP
jgi:hypothetical protein